MFKIIKKIFSRKLAEKNDSFTKNSQSLSSVEQTTDVEPQKKTVLIFDQKARVFIAKTKYSVAALFCPFKKEFYIRKLDGGLKKIVFNPLDDSDFAYPIAGDWAGNGYDGIGIYYPKTGLAFLKHLIDDDNRANTSIDTKLKGDYIPLAGNWNGDGIETLCFYDKKKSVFLFLKKGGKPAILNFGKKGESYFPLSGDWNDNGLDSVGLYEHGSSLFRLKYTLNENKADLIFRFGKNSEVNEYVPLSGNWDGKGADSIGLCDPKTGLFRLKNKATAGKADAVFRIGFEGLRPIEISMIE